MTKEEITDFIEQQLVDTDLFMVGVTISAAMDIDVTLDSDTSVKIEQCIALTRAVEEAFDREVMDYSLTIGSAGIGQPLTLQRQFAKILGADVDVVLLSGTKVHGELVAYDPEQITIKYVAREAVEGKKRKVEVEKQESYNFSDIKSVCEALLV
ncbi:MAG: ribosome assembly cofactor RimP [Mucinivorans sp.]